MKKVTEEEFLKFITEYPKSKLEFDCFGACDPPLMSYNDFSDGKVWPESMVAKFTNDAPRTPNQFFIKEP